VNFINIAINKSYQDRSTLTTFVIAAHEPQSSIQLKHSGDDQEDGDSRPP